MLPIETDLERFRQIVKGRVRKDLKRYISSGEMIARQGLHATVHVVGPILWEMPAGDALAREEGVRGRDPGKPGDVVDGDRREVLPTGGPGEPPDSERESPRVGGGDGQAWARAWSLGRRA